MMRIHLVAPALVVCASLAAAQQPLTTVRVASGITRPVTVQQPQGELQRLYVVEQKSAQIKIVINGVVQATPFINLNTLVNGSGNERGLLGLVFHPNYQNNSFFYVNYTRAGDGATIVERYTALSPDVADPSSGVVVLGPVAQPQSNHNGGHLEFGPDGKLYIGLGDGGNFNDTGTGHVGGGNAQFGGTLLGKMLRLDVDIPFPHIPSDNPFVGTPGTLDEIWDLGLRNPWRYSFDRATGELYIADVGQNVIEEVNVEPAGSTGAFNYGWRCMEGLQCTGLSGCTCNDPSLTLPVHQYFHSGGSCSVSGGYVYRGCAMTDLQGTYFFGDFCSAQLWSFEGAGVANFTNRTAELAPGGGMAINSIGAFGIDSMGEIYICDFGPNFGAAGEGEVYKIVPASGSAALNYCAGKVNSLGCVPFVTNPGGNLASASSTAPFNLRGTDLIPGEAGFFIYGTNGRSSLNFHGGTLCVKAPLTRLLPAKVASNTGTPPCSGTITVNFNNRIQNGSDPSLTVGQVVNAQLRQRDPADPAGFGDSLTDGVEFQICP